MSLRDVAEEGSRKRPEEEREFRESFKPQGVLDPGFEDEGKGQQAKECKKPVEVENDYQPTANKEPNTQSYNGMALNTAINLEEQGNRFLQHLHFSHL